MVANLQGSGTRTADQDLVACYAFNDNAEDSSENQNDGTVFGATPTENRWGQPSAAYEFDGVDDYIIVPRSGTLDITGPLTMTAWVLVRSTGDLRAVIEKEINTTGYNIHMAGDLLHIRVDGGVVEAGTISAEEWHFLVGVHDGISVKGYIDGALAGETGEALPTGVVEKDLAIGAWEGHFGAHERFFDGKIDDIRIYKRDLSETEIEALFILDSDNDPCGAIGEIFSDGFESGDSSAWKSVVP